MNKRTSFRRSFYNACCSVLHANLARVESLCRSGLRTRFPGGYQRSAFTYRIGFAVAISFVMAYFNLLQFLTFANVAFHRVMDALLKALLC